MNLEEAARLIPQLARNPMPGHAPFLESVDELIAGLEVLIPTVQNPKAVEIMKEAMAEVYQSRAEFVRVIPAEMERMRSELIQHADESSAILLEFQKTYNEGMASLNEMEVSAAERMEAARAEMISSIPKPPPAPEPISINPGEELVARLMELGAPAKPPSKVMPSPGNIWENWKPGPGNS